MHALKIGPQHADGSLGFDLEQVVEALDLDSTLRWVVQDAQVIWPDDNAPSEFDLGSGIVELTTDQLERLSTAVLQVIDGTFLGYREEGSPGLAFAAVDSSFWIVWADDATVLERIRERFIVGDIDAPVPTRLLGA